MRRGYWGANLGQPHSIPVKESGKCGSVTVRVSNSTTGVTGTRLVSCLVATSIPLVTCSCLPANTCLEAHPRAPRYLSRRLPSCQASPPARWYRGRLHIVRWLDQDAREHPEGHLRRHLQHLRIPDAQPVEGDEAHQEPPGGVCGYPAIGQEILGAMNGPWIGVW